MRLYSPHGCAVHIEFSLSISDLKQQSLSLTKERHLGQHCVCLITTKSLLEPSWSLLFPFRQPPPPAKKEKRSQHNTTSKGKTAKQPHHGQQKTWFLPATKEPPQTHPQRAMRFSWFCPILPHFAPGKTNPQPTPPWYDGHGSPKRTPGLPSGRSGPWLPGHSPWRAAPPRAPGAAWASALHGALASGLVGARLVWLGLACIVCLVGWGSACLTAPAGFRKSKVDQTTGGLRIEIATVGGSKKGHEGNTVLRVALLLRAKTEEACRPPFSLSRPFATIGSWFHLSAVQLQKVVFLVSLLNQAED